MFLGVKKKTSGMKWVNAICINPVDTRRCFKVYKTSVRRHRRLIDSYRR